jgi:hypothetical protein
MAPPTARSLLASHAAVRAAASARRGRLAGDHHPPQVAALRRGDWVKLICGASFEDAADVRNLSLVYTLAGGMLVALIINIFVEHICSISEFRLAS